MNILIEKKATGDFSNSFRVAACSQHSVGWVFLCVGNTANISDDLLTAKGVQTERVSFHSHSDVNKCTLKIHDTPRFPFSRNYTVHTIEQKPNEDSCTSCHR